MCKSKITSIAMLVVAILISSGCATLRTERITMPTQETAESLAKKAPYYGPSNDDLIEHQKYARGVAGWLWAEADQRIEISQGASEGAFIATVVGVIAGAASKSSTASAAGAAAGGLGLFADRYQLMSQAKNFERASDAFNCMADVIARAADAQALSKAAFGELRVISQPSSSPRSSNRFFSSVAAKIEPRGIVAAQQYLEGAVSGAGEKLRSASRSVFRKLLEAQRAIVIAAPDSDLIKKAILAESPKPPQEAQEVFQVFSADRIADLVELPKRIDVCVASF
jgi:hypothetical protein